MKGMANLYTPIQVTPVYKGLGLKRSDGLPFDRSADIPLLKRSCPSETKGPLSA